MNKIKVSDLASVNLHSLWKSNKMISTSDGSDSHLHTLISSLSSASRKERVNRIWADIRNYATSHPDEVSGKSIRDRRGRSSLHAICAKRPPLQVVQSFLSLGESSSLLSSTDNHGRTPLAISIAHNADSSVIQLLLESYPESSRIKDNTGRLPLHLACSGTSDSTVVKLLLCAYPQAAGILAHNQMQSPLHFAIENSASLDVIKLLVDADPTMITVMESGSTPLAAAIQHNASTEVIRLLIEGNPESLTKVDISGWLPLRHAIEFLAPVDTVKLICEKSTIEVVTSTDMIGRTLLHRALERSRSTCMIVKVLLEKCPELANVSNFAGDTPLDIIYRRLIKLMQSSSTKGISYIDIISSSKRFKPVWEVLNVLVRASVYNTVSETLPNNETFRVLHAVVQTEVPIEIIQFAMLLHPNQVKEIDEATKCLPITLLLQGPSSSNYQAVNLLLDAYPEAVGIPGPSGRCLLSHAAENCLLDLAIIQKIYNICPQMLAMPDPITRLYPFMLAAVPKDLQIEKQRSRDMHRQSLHRRRYPLNCQDIERRDNLTQVNMILELLLASPALVRHNLV